MTHEEGINEDVAKLRDMAREFTEGFNSGNVDRLMKFYGEHYVDVNLRHPLQTNEERRAYYLHVIETRGIRVDVQPDEIVVEGDLAFVRGRIMVTRSEPESGGSGATELRYMELARKDARGEWKAVWGMDGPVQEYEPARG
jgi:ketosteroid isomerase-like protein